MGLWVARDRLHGRSSRSGEAGSFARTSLGRRLSLLVLSELFVALFCGAMALLVLQRISEEGRYMRTYVFPPLVGLGDALAAGSEASSIAPDAPAREQQAIGRVRMFAERYRREWQVVGTTLPDAVRFRDALSAVGRTDLLASEREAIDALDAALLRLDRSGPGEILEMRAALIRLNDVNLRFMEVAYEAAEAKRTAAMILLIIVGAAGVVMAPLLGLAVRHAIVPRVRRLVEKIQRFRDFGLHEPIGDLGGDELALLANTLDLGFAAIAARDRERKRFLSIAAHELKTPLTTIKGFAQVAIDHRNDVALCDRALSVISRQATRLARISEDLLWVASVESGALAFKPGPVNFAQLVERAIGEVSLTAKGHTFPVTARGDTGMIGDRTLLEHAVVGLLVQAASMAAPGAPLPVAITAGESRVRLTVDAPDGACGAEDLDTLIEPFAVLQFEGMGEARSTGLGLHLAREIAKLHGATLHVEPRPEGGVTFAMDLRR